MALPKSVTKVTKDGIKFVDNVDRTKFVLSELIRAALRDTAKLLRKRMIDKLKNLRGMRRSKRIYKSAQYWLRRREGDLVIGFKHGTWYGVDQELGTKGQPARNILRETVNENIDQIRLIQGKYLSAIEDENRAIGLIDVNGDEVKSPEGEE
ncbi:HK97-gp10 family putative phage morphogenesis protein [Anaerobacillus sp. MEB173]|uniref:HK97-gp10 family putative phage morphogenesis protein n=1 Tax=Anaerobacillus sp. MEB173 TaxID=3383345 RepID=UPI003F90946F